MWKCKGLKFSANLPPKGSSGHWSYNLIAVFLKYLFLDEWFTRRQNASHVPTLRTRINCSAIIPFSISVSHFYHSMFYGPSKPSRVPALWEFHVHEKYDRMKTNKTGEAFAIFAWMMYHSAFLSKSIIYLFFSPVYENPLQLSSERLHL